MTGRDWRELRRSDFDASIVDETLFDLPVPLSAAPPADDGCGTGDLLAELDD